MIGEIGGTAEEDGRGVSDQGLKQEAYVAFIAGVYRPSRPPHGSCRRVISGGKGDAKHKIEAMRAAGIVFAYSPAALGTTLALILHGVKPGVPIARLFCPSGL